MNPDAPPETAQFAFLLGSYDCIDRIFNQQDGVLVVNQDGESPQGPFTARLSFPEVRDDGFEWKMDILAAGQVLPWWTSSCKRRR